MASNQAFFDGYADIVIELPGGGTLRRPSLTLAEGARFLRAIMAAQAGDGAALLYVIEEFPRAIGAEKEMEHLTPAECIDVADRFLAHRRTPAAARPARETRPTPGSTT
ncbi:MAG TPA: hypothetical protein VF158_15860 [Longimicrobiales bacterium]